MNVEAIAAHMALSGKVPRRPTRRQSEAHMILLGYEAFVSGTPFRDPAVYHVPYSLVAGDLVLEVTRHGETRDFRGKLFVQHKRIEFRQVPKRFWWPLYQAALQRTETP